MATALFILLVKNKKITNKEEKRILMRRERGKENFKRDRGEAKEGKDRKGYLWI